MMDSLRQAIEAHGASSVIAKFGWGKFRGNGKQSTYKSNKDGSDVVSNDMLLNYIDLQNGDVISTPKANKSEDEDAPF